MSPYLDPAPNETMVKFDCKTPLTSIVKFDWRPIILELPLLNIIRSLTPLFSVRNQAELNKPPPSPNVTSQKTETFDAFSGATKETLPKFFATDGFVLSPLDSPITIIRKRASPAVAISICQWDLKQLFFGCSGLPSGQNFFGRTLA